MSQKPKSLKTAPYTLRLPNRPTSPGSYPQYPHSTIKGTHISVLKIVKIGVHFREIRISVKEEKMVLSLSEHSQKIEKHIFMGKIFILLYNLYLIVAFLYAEVCSNDSINYFVISYRQPSIRSQCFPLKRGVFRLQNICILTQKGLVLRPRISEKGVFSILERR